MRYQMCMKYQVSRAFFEEQVRRGAVSQRGYRNFMWKVRRQRQVRSRFLLFLMTLCLIAGVAAFCFSIISHAESVRQEQSFKYYKCIEVECGDSLWSIAREYADDHYSDIPEYICEVRSMNHLRGDTIREGQKLLIPYYSENFY